MQPASKIDMLTDPSPEMCVRLEKPGENIVLIHNEITHTHGDRQINRLIRYKLIQKLFEYGNKKDARYSFAHFNDAMKARGAKQHKDIYSNSGIVKRSKEYEDPLEDISAVVWIPCHNDPRNFFQVLTPRYEGGPCYKGIKIVVCNEQMSNNIERLTIDADAYLYHRSSEKSDLTDRWELHIKQKATRLLNNDMTGTPIALTRTQAIYKTLDIMLH
ncbi:hypothetical protein HOC35_04015 [Candidatus Woesearchaeota archaeon]|jgi:hypothetical protein|nr:hypothetical protein [Candidatus Woesearchaeota archaeon]